MIVRFQEAVDKKSLSRELNGNVPQAQIAKLCTIATKVKLQSHRYIKLDYK